MKRHQLHPASKLYRIRHSLAHVLAQAVREIRPAAKLGFGPPIDNGFYYDFELYPPLTPEDLPQLEKSMRRIIKVNQTFEREDLPAAELIAQLDTAGATYKTEQAQDLRDKGATSLSVYRNGPFHDLCEGPHVASTRELPADAFKLDSLAGAYWKGSEENPMLQRVYGLAFETKEELKDYQAQRELAKERDHRKLGSELQLFTISEEVGKGMPLWLPAGTVVREELEKLAKETEFQWGYERVVTPHVTKEGLFHKSGHLPYYAADMFPPMEGEEGKFYLKPMNCPFHHLIFKATPRSYRELPLRLAEYGTCYRFEQSGELSGLLRVRAMGMNDAHIYCAEEQSQGEFVSVMRMHRYYYELLGIDQYWVRLSLPDLEASSDKYVSDPAAWARAEEIVIGAMEETGMDYEAVRGEAAFYGPKIDVQIRNTIGREETASTNQLDLIMSERFDLAFIGKDNQRHRPHIIHRAPLGTHERFIAFLIEHYGGVFPTWLAPVQVRLVPVNDAVTEYASRLRDQLRREFVRAELDDSPETFGKKIRRGATSKIPNLFVIGEQEMVAGTIGWKRYGEKAQATLPFDVACEQLLAEIRGRIDWRRAATAAKGDAAKSDATPAKAHAAAAKGDAAKGDTAKGDTAKGSAAQGG